MEWTDEMSSREDMHFDILARLGWSGGAWAFGGAFVDEMVNESFNYDHIDADEVGRTAYWEFTKAIADSVRDSVSASARGPLYLTGHSQGGSRANLVSMYFEKRYNDVINTTTFGAMGGSCFARGNAGFGGSWHMDLTADVDPFIHHPQITEYVHVLDALGFIDYDPGTQCIFGTSDVQSSPAGRWCAHMFGYSGSHLFSAGNIPGTDEIKTSFERCRYFTHVWQPLVQALSNENYLFEDGTTDGGCSPAGPISREDPQELCNTGSGLWELDGCNDQLSCETCAVSSSADIVGFQCFWCAASSSCHPRGVTWLSGCDTGYVGDADQCEAGGADRLNFSDVVLLSNSQPRHGRAGQASLLAALALAAVVYMP